MYNSAPPPRPTNRPDCDSTSIARACREAAATRHTDNHGTTPTESDERGEDCSWAREDGRSNSHTHRYESSRKSEEWVEDRRDRRHGRHRDRHRSRHRRDHRHSSRDDESQAASSSHRNDRYADLSPAWTDSSRQFSTSLQSDVPETDDFPADGSHCAESGDVAAADSSADRFIPDDEEEFEDSDIPVTQSLESRIEAILSQSADCAVPFLSPRSTSPVQPSVPPPPLPVDDGFPGPPLPCPPDASLLADNAQPPLPSTSFWPVPAGDSQDTPTYRDVADGTTAVDVVAAVNGYIGAGDDDDRMSMSSLSSGDEKLEVNVPASTGLGDGQWPSSMGLVANIAYLADKLNQLNDLKSMVEPSPDSLAKFDTVLEQVIKDLRLVMCRDVRKKMIESTGFKSFEKWCDEKVQHRKVTVSSFIIAALCFCG